MSLASFVSKPDVVANIKCLRPKISRKIPAPLKVEPRSNRYMLVGTAFDYMLRFELQRRAPHAIAERWVAESAPDLIYREVGDGVGVGRDMFYDVDPAFYIPPEEIRRRVEKIIAEAKLVVAKYLKNKTPDRFQLANLAANAIRLSKIDSVYRAGRLDPRFEEADPEDIQDLIDMLSIVPFEDLPLKETLLLNPTFGDSSKLVGGADVDLIIGDMLVDFKTTKRNEIDTGYLDQLLGYCFLARNQKRIQPTFPAINQVGVYFCRHGYLWMLETAVWTDHSEFSEIEKWFFERAKKAFGARRPSDLRAKRVIRR